MYKKQIASSHGSIVRGVRCAVFHLLVLLLLTSASYPQGAPRTRVPKKKAPILTAAQEQALQTMDAIALEARQIDDPGIRADLQALIGDALWEFDKPTARSIFLDAFKNATALENKGEARVAQSDVIRHIWLRDPAMARDFLKRLSESEDSQNNPDGIASIQTTFGLTSSDPANLQSLKLADSLFDSNPQAAGDLIDSALKNGVSFAGISRLSQLRESDPERANQIFSRSINQLRSMDPSAGVVAAIAMADYVSPSCAFCPSRPLDPETASLFYQAALNILRAASRSTYAPPPLKAEFQAKLIQYSHEMQAMLAMMLTKLANPADAAELQKIYREQAQLLDSKRQQLLSAVGQIQQAPDKFSAAFSAAESLTDNDQRDSALSKLVEIALSQNPTDDFHQQLEDKISAIGPGALHDRAWSLLKIREVRKDVKDGKLEAAYGLSLRLPDRFVRAQALREVSMKLNGKSDLSLNAADVLSQALQSAESASSSIERTGLMFKIVANFMSLKEDERAFDALLLSSTTVAQLSRDDFQKLPVSKVPTSLFDFAGTFGKLGSVDFEKTMQVAQGIKWKEFRLAAEISTCRSILSP